MKKLLALIVIAFGLWSCKGSDEAPQLPTVASIVSFDGTRDGLSTFSYVEGNETVHLTAAWVAPEDFKAGQRALIYYQAEQYGVDSSIALLQVAKIPMGLPLITDEIPQGVELYEPRAWRSGNWLNVGAQVDFPGQARSIQLLVKEATIDRAFPEAYFVVEADQPGSAARRQLYASFRIDSLLSTGAAEGLKLTLTPSTIITIK